MHSLMLLEMAADGMGDRIAVGSLDDGVTYTELLDRARRTATVIRSAAVDRVGFLDVNSVDVPILLYACAIAGVPFAPVNYRLADEQLRAVGVRLAPAIAVVGEDSVDRLPGIDGLEVWTRAELGRRAAGADPDPGEGVDADDVALWLFTSGTTGEPKAAVLRHRHLVSYVLSTVEFMGAEPTEATLVCVPPYHIAGMATIVSNTFAGRRIVYLPQFDPAEWVRVAERERVTHAMVVPTMLSRILDAIEHGEVSLPTLRHLAYGGGRMPASVIERALDLLPGVGFVNAYGLTETSSTVAVLTPDDHREAHASSDPEVRARLGSVGRPLPSIELEIRDADGIALDVGATGEICVRGEQVAGEYHGRSVLTADGWFLTNDGGRLDSGGFLFVDGRLDDVIVRGGENMSPGEIEDVLILHPAVAEAAVTSIPDDEWGEVVAAAVILEPGASVSEADLQSWVRDHLRSSRVPAIIQVRAELPYSETGKLLRRVLRIELAALRG